MEDLETAPWFLSALEFASRGHKGQVRRGSNRPYKAAQAARMKDASPSARLIKLADQISNIRDMASTLDAWDADAVANYAAGAERVVSACWTERYQELHLEFRREIDRLRRALREHGTPSILPEPRP
ncbi:hypothetical protein [Defluviimonas salinarum]|uniref:Uncharacterized protein n=1 Tax=Defluviimonas salinarum TaxID=2992147 RepID=A0ABT3J5I8_9RHOB|nr:hypothetical protein [Defluviimonas salinarum]MCW3782962.1 hypothetical protein [Defluviimonas salinarum]